MQAGSPRDPEDCDWLSATDTAWCKLPLIDPVERPKLPNRSWCLDIVERRDLTPHLHLRPSAAPSSLTCIPIPTLPSL
jgi:hypothetical protein